MKSCEKIDVNELKKVFPSGTRVRLIFMNDIQAPPPNTVGVVTHVDDAGTIHLYWETGSSLGLIYGIDQFEIID